MVDVNYFWLSLFYWYYRNKRDFPWRCTSSAYNVLIAEYLLQQTNVRKVVNVYSNITSSNPTPYALAKTSADSIYQIIQPIGLHYRAERLIKTAEILCSRHNGRVPKDKNSLIELPGVGEYIAEAVRCYAFNLPTVPVDTNVIRLFSRYYGLISTKTRARTDRELIKVIRSYYNFKDTRVPNLAVLDFASAVCTAKAPACNKCLLARYCVSKKDKTSFGE